MKRTPGTILPRRARGGVFVGHEERTPAGPGVPRAVDAVCSDGTETAAMLLFAAQESDGQDGLRTTFTGRGPRRSHTAGGRA